MSDTTDIRHRADIITQLADEIAFQLYGAGLDHRTPIGWQVLSTTGRELAMPLARAVLECPRITFTPDPA